MEATNTNRPKRVGNFLSRWFTRYLMSTELYMVEPWEKVFIHVVFAIVFSLFWYFNYSIIINIISRIRESTDVQQLYNK